MTNGQDQMDEVNRIRGIIVSQGLNSLDAVAPVDLTLALMILGIETFVNAGVSTDKRHIEQSLHDTITHLIEHMEIARTN